MEWSIEDALKGLEKVHMTIPKQQVIKSENKNPKKPKIFKGESYKVKNNQKRKSIIKNIQRQQQGQKYWYEKNKTKKPEKPLGSIGSFFGTSDSLWNVLINGFLFFIYNRWFGDSDFLICVRLGVDNFDFFPTARRKEDRIEDRTELSLDLTVNVFKLGEFGALSNGLSRNVLAFFNSIKIVLLLLLLFGNSGSTFYFQREFKKCSYFSKPNKR